MATAFQFDVDNGGTDPFEFVRQAWTGQTGGVDATMPMVTPPAFFAVAAAGLLAAATFAAGVAAGYMLAQNHAYGARPLHH